MKIWLAVNGEPTPIDDGNPRLYRVGILSEKLASLGHDVTWWTANTYHQKGIQRTDKTEIRELEKEGYRLVLLNGMGYPKKFSIKRVISHFQNAWEFIKLSKTQEKPDVIFCCYPQIELSYVMSRYAKKHNIPIIIDFRDKWPDVIEENLSTAKKIAGFPLLLFWRYAQKFTVRNAAAITGITSAFVHWALNSGNRSASANDKPFHLAVNPQVPDQKEITGAEDYWKEHGISEDSPQVIGCYTGMLSERVDLKSLVKGALALPEEDKAKIKLVLCGTGDAEDELKEIAKDQPHIHFAGWRGAAELYVLLRLCHFGMLPYFSFEDFQMSYPNKVGEYLSAGLPVFTCLKGITHDLLEQRGLGFYAEETKPESYTKGLQEIIARQNDIEKLKPKAIETFKEFFDGNKIYADLCQYIENIAKK
jgi:glycosyltransferase involved in cell wall biosynthesis